MHIISALPRNHTLFRSRWAHWSRKEMKSTKGLANKPFSTPWDFHASYNPITQHSILKLTLKQGYEKYKQWALKQLLYCGHGCSGEDNWAAGAAQRLEANTKHPSPGWGSTRPRLRVNWSSLNHPQRWTLHKPATGSRPRWLLGRAGTQESPCCEGELTPKQNCYSGSPLPSQSCCTFLLHPLLTTQDSSAATNN